MYVGINISKEPTATIYKMYISCWRSQYVYKYVMLLTAYNMTGRRSLENRNIR